MKLGTSIVIALSLLLMSSAQAEDDMTPTQILKQVIANSGGDNWLRPKTLYLEGFGVFFPKGNEESRVVADHYKMWRRFAEKSENAHLANGMVRIDSFVKDQRMFQMAFDGTNAYNQDGIVPGGAGSPQWRNSFGFGVIRYALNEGFTLQRLPDDTVDGFPVYVIRVIDPSEGKTIFGIDKKTYAARMVGFHTDRGWHHRTYSDFVVDRETGWRQPRLVKLYYDGVKSNEVHWRHFKINEEYPTELFQLPAERL